MTTHYDLIVVGEGYAGLTCAREAVKLGLTVATFEAELFGGLALNINELHHFDEAAGASGMDHAAMLATANAEAGVESINVPVTAIRRAGDILEIDCDAGTRTARAVVIASGARLEKLGIPGEESFEGRGVSRCADCDAPIFVDAKVVVVGDTDWAIHEALVLTQYASTVYLVHEGNDLRACAEYIERLNSQPNIEKIANAAIEEILGNGNGVTGVRVRDSAGTRVLECAGVFPFVGLAPNSEIAPAEISRDRHNALQVDAECETGMPNVFAIGTVRAGASGWLSDAVEDARRAARMAKARLD